MSDKKTEDSLKTLKDISFMYAKTKIAYGVASAKETIANGVKVVRDTCIEGAKSFGIDTKNPSKKQGRIMDGVKEIEEKYLSSLYSVQKEYQEKSTANALELQELEAQRTGYIEKIVEVRTNKEKYISENMPQLVEKRNEKKKELKDMKNKLIEASKRGDFEKVSEYVEKCKSIEMEIAELERDFKDKLRPFDETIEKLNEEYDKADERTEQLEKLEEEMKRDFENECKKAARIKTMDLSKLEGNNFFRKIRVMIAQTIFKSETDIKSFEEKFINPAKASIDSYLKTVPVKVEKSKRNFETKVKKITGKTKDALWTTKDREAEKVMDKEDTERSEHSDISTRIREAYNEGTRRVKGKIDTIRSEIDNGIIALARNVEEKAGEIQTKTKERSTSRDR